MKRLILTLMLTLLAFQLFGAGQKESYVKAEKLYEAQKLQEALDLYTEEETASPESPYLFFNKGVVFFRMEDFDKAIEAFEKAAYNTEDLKLEGKANFNLGNSEYMRGAKLAGSDLEKAIEHFYKSINYYQRALELDSDIPEAERNIEVTRLLVKQLLDKLKEQQEQNKEQQEKIKKIVEKLLKLIEQEELIIDQTGQVADELNSRGISRSLRNTGAKIRTEQSRIMTETQGVSGELEVMLQEMLQQAAAAQGGGAQVPQMQQMPPELMETPVGKARGHVDKGANFQSLAVNQLEGLKVSEAGESEKSARDELVEAVKALTEGDQNQQQDQQQQDQQQQDQKDQQEQDKQQDQQSPEDQEKEEEEKRKQEDAMAILDEERENKEKREQEVRGQVSGPQKDW